MIKNQLNKSSKTKKESWGSFFSFTVIAITSSLSCLASSAVTPSARLLHMKKFPESNIETKNKNPNDCFEVPIDLCKLLWQDQEKHLLAF